MGKLILPQDPFAQPCLCFSSIVETTSSRNCCLLFTIGASQAPKPKPGWVSREEASLTVCYRRRCWLLSRVELWRIFNADSVTQSLWLFWKTYTWRLHIITPSLLIKSVLKRAFYSVCHQSERQNHANLLCQHSAGLSTAANPSYNEWPQEASLQLVFCA